MNILPPRLTTVVLLLLGTIGLSACASNETASVHSVGTTTPAHAPVHGSSTAGEHSLYELRTYTTNEGKLDALQARFRDHTMALFEKHGAKNIAYWIPTEQPNTLIYIIAHKSVEARAASWKSFLADPEWRSAYAASIANGKLNANVESVLMRATDYSPFLK